MIALGANANAPPPAADATLAVDIIKGLEGSIKADDKDTALKLLHELGHGLQVACTKRTELKERNQMTVVQKFGFTIFNVSMI